MAEHERKEPKMTSSPLTREDRWEALSGPGATIWLTGFSGSGKSTIASALERRLLELGRRAYRLDGDELRLGLNSNLGFSKEDRAENVRRTAEVARILADSGTLVIASLISPYASDRGLCRSIHVATGLDFMEVFVDTPLEVCEQRDPKGLYRKARAGEIRGFTGVDDPYEVPESPDLVLRPAETSLDDCVEACLRMIEGRLDMGRQTGA